MSCFFGHTWNKWSQPETVPTGRVVQRRSCERCNLVQEKALERV